MTCRDHLQDLLDGTRVALEEAQRTARDDADAAVAAANEAATAQANLEAALAEARKETRASANQADALRRDSSERQAAYDAQLEAVLARAGRAEEQVAAIAVCPSACCCRRFVYAGFEPADVTPTAAAETAVVLVGFLPSVLCNANQPGAATALSQAQEAAEASEADGRQAILEAQATAHSLKCSLAEKEADRVRLSEALAVQRGAASTTDSTMRAQLDEAAADAAAERARREGAEGVLAALEQHLLVVSANHAQARACCGGRSNVCCTEFAAACAMQMVVTFLVCPVQGQRRARCAGAMRRSGSRASR
jgi:hypothetical protein